jgi:uracil-DNA glycosylase
MDLWSKIPPVWRPELLPVQQQIRFLGQQIQDLQLNGTTVLPRVEQIFNCLQVAPQVIRVVIVGQDPYPNPEHAMGLSFSVPTGTKPLPGSLRNILLELKNDVGTTATHDGNLDRWVRQGVLLLNRKLTYQSSGAELNWDDVVRQILLAANKRNPHLVAVLWGKSAQTLASSFSAENIIVGVHPSPLSAHRGFFGSRPFSAANRLLVAHQQRPIDW